MMVSNLLNFERTWWWLFQKCGMRTNIDIYVFIPS
jgi:hypothetical protein